MCGLDIYLIMVKGYERSREKIENSYMHIIYVSKLLKGKYK